jgi:DNA mismatch repair ATPase MutS
MRTTDSLSDSESYFYAELKRLGKLKERLERKENIFFLLDEILKGTNSKDKSEGARIFIEKITEYQATGIIATHDILLGRLEENYKSIKNRCFEIEIEGDEVKFDYILRDGLAEKMNAAILMKQMGII